MGGIGRLEVQVLNDAVRILLIPRTKARPPPHDEARTTNDNLCFCTKSDDGFNLLSGFLLLRRIQRERHKTLNVVA
jgi:hypothetical protein